PVAPPRGRRGRRLAACGAPTGRRPAGRRPAGRRPARRRPAGRRPARAAPAMVARPGSGRPPSAMAIRPGSGRPPSALCAWVKVVSEVPQCSYASLRTSGVHFRPAPPSLPAQAYPGRLAHHPSPPLPGPIHGRAAGLSSPSSAIDTRDMSTRSVLRRRFDVWRPKDLRAEGTSDRSRSRMIRSGDLISLGKGWYSSPGTPPEVAGPLSRGHRSTCITAAEMHGLWVPASAKVHEVGLRRESETSEPAVTWHRPIVRAWPDDEPIMPLRVALVHAAHCLPPWEAAALLESALERWQLGPDEVAEILRALPRTRRRAPGRYSTRDGSSPVTG